MTTRERLTPRRDKSTWVTYLLMGAYGAWVYSFGAIVSHLSNEQGLAEFMAGLYATFVALGLIVMSSLNARIAARLGRGGAMRLGSGISIVGLLLISSGLPLPVTYAGAFVAACGGALAVSGVSAFITKQQGPAAAASLSEANVVAALGSYVGPVAALIGLAVWPIYGWRIALWVVAVLYILVEVLRGANVRVYDGGDVKPVSGRVRDLPPLFWWTAVNMLPAAGLEYCLAFWIGDYFKARTGWEGNVALIALMAIVTGILIGRFVGSRLAEWMDPEKLLAGAFALSGLAFLIVWSIPNPTIMLIFLVVTGCGVGLHWPLSIGRSVRSAVHIADRAAGTGLLAAGIAVGVAPFVLKSLTGVISIQWAFLIVPGLAALGVFLVLFRPVPQLTEADSRVDAESQ
jgi:fucose permease